MKPIIREVTTKSELKKFVKYPNYLYRHNKYYVPQLISSEMTTLSKDKNHAFEFCESKYWLAYDEKGHIVGRIAGIINHKYNEKTGVKYVRFGWLDFIDDSEVVDALFDVMERWAIEQGAESICGPLGLLEFDASGVLVDGFNEIPTAYGKYNDPYYEGHILRHGYIKDVDWVEYRITMPKKYVDAYERMSNIIAAKYNIHAVMPRNKKQLLSYVDQIFTLLNKAYSKIHGFSELSKGQQDDLKDQFFSMINLDYIVLVMNQENTMVGFGICLPSISKALQRNKGHLYPFGFISILRALRKNDTLDSLLIAVDDDYRNKGVTALIFNNFSRSIYKNGIKYMESTRELENNYNVLNLWNRHDYRLHKRARCYIKKIK